MWRMPPSLPSIISRLHLKHLRLLVALAEQGSLVKAAGQVHMTQPGATKTLQDIEAALGATLFTRNNRGLVPNALGQCVLRYARLILTDIAHLREEMIGVLQGHGGRLSVGTIMGAVPFLTETLSRLIARQPTLSIEIVEDTSAQLLRLLDEGRLDAAICRTSISKHPELYQALKVRDEQLAVVANAQHPLAQAKRLAIADLASYRWVVYSANMPMRLLLEREFHEAGLPFPGQLIETTSAFATLSFLQQHSAMVALLSVDVAQFFQRFGLTTVLPLALESRSEPYWLVTRRDRPVTPVAHMLMAEFAEAALAEAPPRARRRA
jgi:DNA-binding transcriptional LysR family regulator